MTFLTVLDSPKKSHFPHTVGAGSIKMQHITQESLFSDHHMVHFNFITKLSLPTKVKLTYRKLKNINTTSFGLWHHKCCSQSWSKRNVAGRKHCCLQQSPVKNTRYSWSPDHQKVIIRNKIPWFSDNIMEQIQLCCKLERKWSCDKSMETSTCSSTDREEQFPTFWTQLKGSITRINSSKTKATTRKSATSAMGF